MAELGSEDGEPKLDWVEGVARLLADPSGLEAVEAEARDIHDRGIRHIIWAGMGGSIGAVRVLVELGLTHSPAIHPLDSTDPAALNRILEAHAADQGHALDSGEIQPGVLNSLLADSMMVGVAMGMTSEEPITHLEWFAGLLQQAGLPAGEHMLVMALPGSYLDDFARRHDVPIRPLQLDGGSGTGGRMSAPTTRVFLLPAAFVLSGYPFGMLRSVLQAAWQVYDLARAERDPANHPAVRLAVMLHDAAHDGAVRLLLQLPAGWDPLMPWIEQLMEESLGKDGKGVLVFPGQMLDPNGAAYQATGSLRLAVGEHDEREKGFDLLGVASDSAAHRLARTASAFLGWQLTMALYGYLTDIPFAGQPAVETYKARARALRQESAPVTAASRSGMVVSDGLLTLLAPPGPKRPDDSPAVVVGRALLDAVLSRRIDYLDLTFNGELPAEWIESIDTWLTVLANKQLGVPFKLRRAPAAYHATEQSEMDGPPGLVSLRIVRRRHERIHAGSYSDRFLLAQAAATWQAMIEAGRSCFLLVIDGTEDEGLGALQHFTDVVDSFFREA